MLMCLTDCLLTTNARASENSHYRLTVPTASVQLIPGTLAHPETARNHDEETRPKDLLRSHSTK